MVDKDGRGTEERRKAEAKFEFERFLVGGGRALVHSWLGDCPWDIVSYFAVYFPCGDQPFFVGEWRGGGMLRLSRPSPRIVEAMYCNSDNEIDLYNM